MRTIMCVSSIKISWNGVLPTLDCRNSCQMPGLGSALSFATMLHFFEFTGVPHAHHFRHSVLVKLFKLGSLSSLWMATSSHILNTILRDNNGLPFESLEMPVGVPRLVFWPSFWMMIIWLSSRERSNLSSSLLRH